jgi:hypothetical protein
MFEISYGMSAQNEAHNDCEHMSQHKYREHMYQPQYPRSLTGPSLHRASILIADSNFSCGMVTRMHFRHSNIQIIQNSVKTKLYLCVSTVQVRGIGGRKWIYLLVYLGARRSGFESQHRQDSSLIYSVQTGSGALPASYPKGTEGKTVGAWNWPLTSI